MDLDLQEPESGLTPTSRLAGGRAAEAIDFYKQAFGATEVMRHAADDGRLMHAHLKVNGASLMLHDHFPEHHGGAELPEPAGVMIHLQVQEAGRLVEPRDRRRRQRGDGAGRPVLGRPLWPDPRPLRPCLVDRRAQPGTAGLRIVGAEIRAFFDEPTNTVSYLVWDPGSRRGVAIDPVLDFDAAAGTVDDGSVEELLSAAADEGVTIEWVLETHIHADHLSGGAADQGPDRRQDRHRRTCPRSSEHLPADLRCGGCEGRKAAISTGCSRTASGWRSAALSSKSCTPPATRRPASATRSATRYSSATHCSCPTTAPPEPISPAAVPASSIGRSRSYCRCRPETRLFMCHDYKAPGRDQFAWETTVGEERRTNKHIHEASARRSSSPCGKSETVA